MAWPHSFIFSVHDFPHQSSSRFSPDNIAMDDLDRLVRRLVQNVRNSHPQYLSQPVEVSELYQTLIP